MSLPAGDDTVVAAGSVKEAITAVNPNLVDAGLSRIAEASPLRRAVETPPAGWGTPVGELGERLSGGERQRFGIACALVRDAPPLLVDGATSALSALPGFNRFLTRRIIWVFTGTLSDVIRYVDFPHSAPGRIPP